LAKTFLVNSLKPTSKERMATQMAEADVLVQADFNPSATALASRKLSQWVKLEENGCLPGQAGLPMHAPSGGLMPSAAFQEEAPSMAAVCSGRAAPTPRSAQLCASEAGRL